MFGFLRQLSMETIIYPICRLSVSTRFSNLLEYTRCSNLWKLTMLYNRIEGVIKIDINKLISIQFKTRVEGGFTKFLN